MLSADRPLLRIREDWEMLEFSSQPVKKFEETLESHLVLPGPTEKRIQEAETDDKNKVPGDTMLLSQRSCGLFATTPAARQSPVVDDYPSVGYERS